ncbi:aryl-alcohol dehydrogenase-like predicted oxidoreductase [Archangium gephyra]|uniref:Aryl-alcohol dehydrogenase-like predicted oxidoreductase n=1 Tax=Archangium gephyra TaxID=48 RepID=A0AAC8Q7I3_9BACT|nr:aldo/keto reductase [Archangium gephyra]AKJ02485.1 L-fuco-beta-pyranose dehydrogenase [Archangium gephyra]REG28593.1 aryl-alcohol dehydrogenase-like predicted oxidoreductase [Archangium gephyra]
MPLDHYVTLGRSGLRVSPLCLGAMTFGEGLGWGSSVEESQQIIDRYIELGGNFIDTANFYTKSHSEKIIGDHIGRHPARRDRLVLATKFSGNLYPGDPNGGGSGRKSIISACENSLRRLQTDYIDLYWLHNWDVHTPMEETMAALEDLVRAGKVRYLGVSDTPAWKIVEANMLARFRGWSAFIGLQIEYSLLERTVEQELVPMAREFGLGITPWSPLKSGALSGKYTRANAGKLKGDRGMFLEPYLNERTYTVVDALEAIARAHESTVARVALAWVQAQPGVTSTIIGARRLSQLEDNVKGVDVKLTAEELGRLDALTKPAFGFPQSMQPMFPAIHNGGTTVNGIYAPASPFGIEKGEKPY